jgi:hypothetical protein
MAETNNLLRIKVRIGDKEAEVSYPLSERHQVDYKSDTSTLLSAIKALKDMVNTLKEEC